MNNSLSNVIDSFRGLNVLVIGEAMLDRYLEGPSRRLCQEAPVPVVSIDACRDAPGGAANTAVNVRSLGARVNFVSVVGDDGEGQALRRALEEGGVDTDDVFIERGRRTLAKQRVIAGSQILVRFDQGTTEPLSAAAEDFVIGRLTELFSICTAVIVSDYGYGVLTPRVLDALGELQARTPRLLVGDSKRLAAYRRLGFTAVKPNYGEALQLLGPHAPDPAHGRIPGLIACRDKLLRVTGARLVAVTLDTEGALLFEYGRPPYRTYSRPRAQTRAAGAGDTYISALTLALAAGADAPAAAELASAAAEVVVCKDGTAACTAAELKVSIAPGNKPAADVNELALRLDALRRQGASIVFTNGCFDILHRGHVTYLSRAKSLGDVLVVGVNSDESIRRLKGSGRPINSLEDRVQVLAGLSCVDLLIPFDDDTPHELIRAIRPNVFVKGGDYTRDRLPEAALVEELGGTVRILPYVENRSTSSLIDRIRALTSADGKANPAAPLSPGRGLTPAANGRAQEQFEP